MASLWEHSQQEESPMKKTKLIQLLKKLQFVTKKKKIHAPYTVQQHFEWKQSTRAHYIFSCFFFPFTRLFCLFLIHSRFIKIDWDFDREAGFHTLLYLGVKTKKQKLATGRAKWKKIKSRIWAEILRSTKWHKYSIPFRVKPMKKQTCRKKIAATTTNKSS